MADNAKCIECCYTCKSFYRDYGFDCCLKHDILEEYPDTYRCGDYVSDYDEEFEAWVYFLEVLSSYAKSRLFCLKRS